MEATHTWREALSDDIERLYSEVVTAYHKEDLVGSVVGMISLGSNYLFGGLHLKDKHTRCALYQLRSVVPIDALFVFRQKKKGSMALDSIAILPDDVFAILTNEMGDAVVRELDNASPVFSDYFRSPPLELAPRGEEILDQFLSYFHMGQTCVHKSFRVH